MQSLLTALLAALLASLFTHVLTMWRDARRARHERLGKLHERQLAGLALYLGGLSKGRRPEGIRAALMVFGEAVTDAAIGTLDAQEMLAGNSIEVAHTRALVRNSADIEGVVKAMQSMINETERRLGDRESNGGTVLERERAKAYEKVGIKRDG
jgi:hypothetical protein